MAEQKGSGDYQNAYKFNGKELDDETGLYYYGARYYNPKDGPGFLSVDPMAEKFPGVNPYTYCMGNPVRYVDPTGMDPESVDYPIYGKDGSYLGDDGRTGGDLAFTGEKDAKGGFKNLQQFTDNHTDFTKASGKLRKESSGNKTESLWIAHTAENASNNRDTKKGDGAVGQLLSSAYSTTSASASSIKDNSSKTNNARAGLIDVLSGGADPTGGSVLWDGQDFLPKGLSHNKFREYGQVTIFGSDLNSLITNQNSLYGTTPSADFSQTNTLIPSYSGWSGGNFYSNEKSNNKTYYNLTSGGTQGGTIFWKISKK
jgi:RHS repeat-associated protein